MKEDIKNLEEIINLCKEEINNNDKNATAILDLEDLKSLENLLTRYKQLEEENKRIKSLDIYKLVEDWETRQLISVSKVEEQIKWLDNDIKNTKYKLEHGKTYPNYIGEHRRLRMKAFIIKSKEIKERLQELLREE